MRQIYHFESAQPPHLSAARLEELGRKRRLRRRIALISASAWLTELCLIAAAVLLRPLSLALSVACVALSGLLLSGAAAVAVIFYFRRDTICPSASYFHF